MSTRSEGSARAPAGTPIPMEEAVGYSSIECRHQVSIDDYLVLKHDRLFLLIDPHGNITPPGRCGLGLFFDDTRILSHYELNFTGGPAALLSSKAPEMYNAHVDLAINDRAFGGLSWDPQNVVYARREMLLDDRLTERVTLTSYLGEPLDFEVELTIGCDFADIFEVRGWERPERGEYMAPRIDDAEIEYSYRGRDGEVIGTVVRFRDPPDELHAHGASWRFRLEPHRPVVFEWEVAPGSVEEEFEGGLVEREPRTRAIYESWREECTRWSTDVEQFNDAIGQAITDLRALYIRDGDEKVISAGIPWYSTVFGRDSIITSLETLSTNPQIAVDTLRYLARHQGRVEDPFTEEQPGKILHELRRGEMARSGEIPHVPYYGTIDATPLWLVLLHETWRWTGDEALVRELLPNARRALEWIDRYGDVDGDGLVEYARTSEKGLVNQGWKDSGDAIVNDDGSLARPPIALVEVQGYVHLAKTELADLYARAGDAERAAALRREAAALRERFNRDFWLEDRGFYALALQEDDAPAAVLASNPGHALWAGIADEEKARRTVEKLMGEEMFSGYGVRTLATSERRYNPVGYHLGTVWPHDNSLLAAGFRRYGLDREALRIFEGILDAATHFPHFRLPEVFAGYPREAFGLPVRYPVACHPQAWAAGSMPFLLQTLLGLEADGFERRLRVVRPLLPDGTRTLEIRGVRVGAGRADLRFRNRHGRTGVEVLAADGVDVVVDDG